MAEPQARDMSELFEALERVAPELETFAQTAEELRGPPPEMVKLMREARLTMAKIPGVLGGYELSPPEQARFFERLAYANPTAGWVGFIYNGGGSAAGAFLPDEGVERVFAEDAPAISGIAAPTGTYRRVDGGFELSGRWSFASGVQQANWITVIAGMNPDDVSSRRSFALPPSELKLYDNWNVSALQGTGSIDVEARELFVPESMTWSLASAPKRGGPLYGTLPLLVYVAAENLGFQVGVAKRLVDEIATLARTRRRGVDPDALANRGAFQYELGRVDLQVEAARALAHQVLGEVWAFVSKAGEPLSAELEAKACGTSAYVTHLLCDAATRIYPFAGARTLALSSPIQRCFRDLHGSSQHYFMSNRLLDAWGRFRIDHSLAFATGERVFD